MKKRPAKNASPKVPSPTQIPPGGSRDRRARRSAPAAPVRSLAGIPVELLAAELRRRQSELPRLEATARALREQLAGIETRIALLSGRPVPASSRDGRGAAAPASTRHAGPKKAAAGSSGGARRGRAGEGPTVAERIMTFLQDRTGPSSPSEIAGALAKELRRELNQSLLVQVSITLRKLVNKGLVQQPARAQYVAAGAAKGGANEATG